jgi:hypothetical protein
MHNRRIQVSHPGSLAVEGIDKRKATAGNLAFDTTAV